MIWDIFSFFKALANEETLLRTHCCRHKCFPVCLLAQHSLRTHILCPGHKNVSDFVQKRFVSATNVSQFAQPKKHHGQQCVRNIVSSFTRAFRTNCAITFGTRAYMLRGFLQMARRRNGVQNSRIFYAFGPRLNASCLLEFCWSISVVSCSSLNEVRRI